MPPTEEQDIQPTTVGELIDELSVYSRDQRVLVTWEGILREPQIYESLDHVVIIDADKGKHKNQWLNNIVGHYVERR